LSMLPLACYHKGFMNVFVLISWFSGVMSTFLMISIVGNMTMIMSKDEEYEKRTNQADKDAYINTKVAGKLLDSIVAKKGIEYIYAELEQHPVDRVLLIGTISYLVFMSHFGLAFLWLLKLGAHRMSFGLMQHYDDSVLEKI